MLLFLGLQGCSHEQENKHFLSHLRVGAGDALFTTYAAAMERSEFVLDQGYAFNFYDPTRGIDFVTDSGSDMCLAFKMGEKWVYYLSDMHKPPVITVSYPDLVTYHYYPFAGIKVEVTFLVQSSRSAIQEVTVTNEQDMQANVEVFPFMKNRLRLFNQAEWMPENNGFSFMHEEYPDSWTLGHGLPYEDTIQNLYAIAVKPDDVGAFNSWEGEPGLLPFAVHINKKPGHQIAGRALSASGERNQTRPPEARVQVFLHKNRDLLLTERSPVWGSSQGSIDQKGYFRSELGHFENIRPGDAYTLTYYDEKKHQGARYTGKATGKSNFRKDVTLAKYELLAIPVNLRLGEESNGRSLRLFWDSEADDLQYHVYRRDYPDAIYRKLSKRLDNKTFTDTTITPGRHYGYVVVATDPRSGEAGMHSREIMNIPAVAFRDFVEGKEVPFQSPAKVVSFKKVLTLEPGKSEKLRIIRTTGTPEQPMDSLNLVLQKLFSEAIQPYQTANEKLMHAVPALEFEDPDKELLYWSAFNMMRQVFYPPEAKSSHNYYVFSREPTWGWGHGGQVFHESIAMLAYAYLDPESAMNSQRVYKERQYESGYINYRTGSYLDEIIEYNGQLTTSAPWYNWLNWEVYRITKDKQFLEEMYASGKKFYHFYTANRDSDNDGLCEWGGHAILESVRDALVAVWDEVGWPANFEALDLNCMLVKEAKSLEAMAIELGLGEEAAQWKNDHEERTKLINQVFWDEENGFYYNVDKTDHDFSFKTENDLKRDEIIGFLPIWAGVASPQQAAKLVEKLTNEKKFWRKYGIPSLSADDPFYNDKGYWNGPVWVQWNYLITRGLQDYGYQAEAKALTEKVTDVMILELKKTHNLWEFYSPDESWSGYHKTYIWAGIINRMMMDVMEAEKNTP